MTNKARAMLLLQYLKENSDENKAVTHPEIRKMFKEKHGVDVPVATIRADVASMLEAGYHIDVREVNGVATYYKYLDYDWSRTELQILIDAVASGHFITKSLSEKMIDKLRAAAAPSDRGRLMPAVHVEDRVKARNEGILEIVQRIQSAIANNHMIKFQYYVYDKNMKRVKKHNGYWYHVSPYALLWQNDRYYLVGWSEKHNDVVHFRVDRMGKPEQLPHLRHPAPDDLDLQGISEKMVSMYRGPERTVTLRCRPELLDNIIDQFGENLKISRIRDRSIDVEVKVRVAPTFFGWLFTFVGEMTVVSPDDIRIAYENKAGEVLEEFFEGVNE